MTNELAKWVVEQRKGDDGCTLRTLVIRLYEALGRPPWMVEQGWITRLFEEGKAPDGFSEFTGNQIMGTELEYLAEAIIGGEASNVEKVKSGLWVDMKPLDGVKL